ncbi:prenyltransferase/squalene oxidase repeat-containing protein [Rhodopirellula europaea]|uniref:Putative secreted protein n=1 Tax=Rhodopirellula europaea SH398 TaxID=1263868 RepID=M5SJG3_9BACT|nr:prenyltransferase/squalene oxidase repeat-containing protein [Rhodopirellula europaea]EMI27857.1 putative secreted protein [Rhodopirellula europaea SH398]|tara:strand:+ start:50567 stop:51817 length:1251 start_codon:yes stop_codon:yes gene_type:complete
MRNQNTPAPDADKTTREEGRLPSLTKHLNRRRPIALQTALAAVFACVAVPATAQDAAPVIATSANLSAALPASEWARVESSVDDGLKWLASQQAEDGRFPSEEVAQPAVTSLAIMAFLSRGHLPDKGPYGSQISRAIDFVLSTQRRRGYFSLQPVLPPVGHLKPSQTVIYNHSIAGLMLGEVYGMGSGERSQRIEEALHRALVFHREVQSRTKGKESDHGGWRYGYPESPDAASDMSVTGWALMFLRSARNAEFNVPKQYFDEGLNFVELCYEPDIGSHEKGVFRYRPHASQDKPQITLANTASATLTLILGGRQDHASIPVSVRWFRTRNYPSPWQNNYYYLATYYSSQAMAQVGGDTWDQMFPQIAAGLLKEQTESGAWPPGGSNEQQFGSTYSTSLAILALTPAYGLLPIYQR